MLQHKIARRCRTPFPQAQLKCSGTTLCTTQFSSAFVLKGMCVASRKISRGATPSRMGYFPVQSARFASISRPRHGSNGSAGGKRHTVSHGICGCASWERIRRVGVHLEITHLWPVPDQLLPGKVVFVDGEAAHGWREALHCDREGPAPLRAGVTRV